MTTATLECGGIFTMAKGRGRPRKEGPREPNGQLQRPTLARILEAEREVVENDRQNAMGVVLAQPHRRGNDHPWCATALGRFCLANRLKRELHHAGEEFADVMRRWRAAKGVPASVSLGFGRGGDGPSSRTVAAWWEQIRAAEDSLRDRSKRHLAAVRHLVIDDADLPAEFALTAIEGLVILARSLGVDIGKHPFA